MSLYGSGRREGVVTVLALLALALCVHALGAFAGLTEGFEGDLALARGMDAAHRVVAKGEWPLWDPAGAGAPMWARGAEMLYPPWWLLGRGKDELWLPVLVALHAALACGLAFRFLRAQGRSRYAAFVCGAAYGLGAHAGHLSANLPELAALAFAPLPLEILQRIVRGERQRHLAFLLGPAIAVPFWTGGVVTASLVALLVLTWLIGALRRELPTNRSLAGVLVGSFAIGIALTAPQWLGLLELPANAAPPTPPFDLVQTLRRVVGPLLPFLAVLGVLRRQRGASPMRWLSFAAVGAALALLLPMWDRPFHGWAPWARTPGALWWPLHLALVLLASNGLDDFLDLPLRRRSATAWTLVLATGLAPLGFVLGERGASFQVECSVLFALAVLFAIWRSLGILRFKTVVAAAAMVWLSAATLHEQARATRAPMPMPTLTHGQSQLPAAPMFESNPPARVERATIAFDLFPADRDEAPLPVAGAPGTAIRDLPRAFVPAIDAAAKVLLRAETPNESEFLVTMPTGRGALVVGDTWTPGWRAFVGSDRVPLLSTVSGARAVLLESGVHRVRFEYHPLAFAPGLYALASGLALSLVWGVFALASRWLSSRKNSARGRRNEKASRPPRVASTAIATKANAGSTS